MIISRHRVVLNRWVTYRVDSSMTAMNIMRFDANQYDLHRRMFIPCFDELYCTAIRVLEGDRSSPLKVLDLGAGTGLFSAMVQKEFPQAHLTLVDQQPEMLEQAKKRFQKSDKLPTLITGDYREFAFSDRYDLIVSALSLHHLIPDETQALYHRTYQALHPGGQFLNVDEVLGETPTIEQCYRQNWAREVQDRGATPNQIAKAQDHANNFDHPASLSNHLTWLKSTGFQQVNCWYQNFSFAVISGIRRGKLPSTDQPVLETSRLVLRPFRLSDAADVQRLAGDRTVAANTLTIPHPYPDGAAEAWIQSLPEQFINGSEIVYAITLRSTGELCGSVGLSISAESPMATLGYWMGQPYRNQGYCTEAAKILVNYGFHTLGLSRIQATHISDNPASGRVMEKIGMVYEGCLRQHTHRWGKLRDLSLYALLKCDDDSWCDG